ncbi:MAG: ErfK/YbiS/YcfS/YnhG family protein [uncultured Thiotrichaceae bacterium]|uniref:ErfK/YbiS/YcfS/YnhG family protein n=1 Tax=uncultured Thiotrichaceae bacterium TaxID=298394 RepID=A0A6S6U1A2_9GAMM|nr:MAG: ErfK/YbiS/YcfS/YnhG family protein [uncultured Thiotrichaceae bacterium]
MKSIIYRKGCLACFLGMMLLVMQSSACAQSSDESNIAKLASASSNIPPSIHDSLVKRLQDQHQGLLRSSIIVIDISEQALYHYKDDQLAAKFSISSAAKGVGSESGSGKTPLGAHRISQKFGDRAPLGTIFKARRNTGVIAKIIKDPIDVPSDAVTTRVLWLDGLEAGKNKGGNVDSKRRYIYIHGTPEEGLIGRPASHGCIRMYNRDVVELFNEAPVNSIVYIQQ